MAWNYSELMVNLKLAPPIDPTILIEKAKVVVMRYPKVALSIFSKIGTNVKINEALQNPLQEDIVWVSHIAFLSII